MQTDMHYYGTLAMAVSAGIPKDDAEVIAYAAQFVDDSTKFNSESHDDGGLLYGIGTAHHPQQSFFEGVKTRIKFFTVDVPKEEEYRRVWIPFHFFPGGAGRTFSEKIICKKDGAIAREMFCNHIKAALEGKAYGLALLGIAAHVYMDTFSHYGFSGLESEYNGVDRESMTFVQRPANSAYVEKKANIFWDDIKADGADVLAFNLGHAGVATYPDRPYLNWRFDFKLPRPENGRTSIRDNSADYLEGCQKLHEFFSIFAKKKYAENNGYLPFDSIKEKVNKIICLECEKQNRIAAWLESELIPKVAYNAERWEYEKNMFPRTSASDDGIKTDAYKFHQAAAYHRYYVLKDLLPSHGIAVY